MQHATALLFPSIWYEGMPVVLAEAYATGLPVIASRLGAMTGLIIHEENGLHVEPGDSDGLQRAARRIASAPEFAAKLRRNARATYKEKYTPQTSLKILLQTYEDAQKSYSGS
jgi:glycosyltransferase involved in cell wall biosynthesis